MTKVVTAKVVEKPPTYDAIFFEATLESAEELIAWCDRRRISVEVKIGSAGVLQATFHHKDSERTTAYSNGWIVDEDHHIVSYDPHIFERKYEATISTINRGR